MAECKAEGCHKTAGKSGYCKQHYSEIKIKELEEEKKPIIKIIPKETREEHVKQIITKSKEPPPPPPKEISPYEKLKEKVIAQSATAKEYEEYEKLKGMIEESKKLKEETGKVGWKEGFLGRLGFKPGESAKKQTEQKNKGMPKSIAFKGFDKLKGIWSGAAGTAKKTGQNAFLFAIYFPMTLFSITGMLIPSVEGLTGMAIGGNIPGLAWLTSQTLNIVLIVFALMFGVILPPSLILGKQGLDFGGLNSVLLSVTAISAGAWGTTNVFMPAIKTFMPGEYAMMMCLIKYKGNMMICVAPGNQTVQYEKVGTYETITSELGAVSPSKSIPPMNPVPSMWSPTYPYYLPFTLKNNNQVGSPYYINVTDITVYASSQESAYNESEGAPTPSPTASDKLTINPGGYYVVSVKFDDSSDFSAERSCEQYTYFQINVTTEQFGGGSTKFGVIQSDEGIDNQNFMYFFDPDVKTEPGPLDIYTYTLPFVVPTDKAEDWQTQGDPGFLIFIHVTNQGDGEAEVTSLELHQTTPGIHLNLNDRCDCMGYVYSGENVTQISSSCSEHLISFETFSVPSGVGAMISCKGWFKNFGFVGKSTQFISVDAEYGYKQTFDEQIACYKYGPGGGDVAEDSCEEYLDCCSVRGGLCKPGEGAVCQNDGTCARCGLAGTPCPESEES